MKVYREIVIFLFFLGMSCDSASLDFIECGGDPVSTVFIDGCTNTPCSLKMGESYHLLIQPKYINPQVDDALVEIGIRQYGAYFEQNTTCDNPCIQSCPITTKLIEPQFNINFNVSSRMVPLTSILQVNTTYYYNNAPSTGFCIQMDAIVTN